MNVTLWNTGKQAQADHSQKQLWIALSIIHQSCTDTRERQSASGTVYMHVFSFMEQHVLYVEPEFYS